MEMEVNVRRLKQLIHFIQTAENKKERKKRTLKQDE